MDAMVARLRGFPDAIRAAAPSIAHSAKQTIDENIAAGRGPDGAPWKATKDGHAPLAHAAGAVTSRATGTTLILELTGKEVWHHFGTRRVPARPILPTLGLPLSMKEAIKRGIVQVFKDSVAR
jgi:hypothetical protein